jgi:hypothetical protein
MFARLAGHHTMPFVVVGEPWTCTRHGPVKVAVATPGQHPANVGARTLLSTVSMEFCVSWRDSVLVVHVMNAEVAEVNVTLRVFEAAIMVFTETRVVWAVLVHRVTADAPVAVTAITPAASVMVSRRARVRMSVPSSW